MRKSIASVLMIILLVFLFACSTVNNIIIEGTPEEYSPLSSSIRGIQLSVSNSSSSDEIVYRWKTTGGTFFNNADGTAVVEYKGKTVFWSCSLEEMNKCYAGDNTTISVTAYNTKTDKAVANGSIEIIREDSIYTINN